MNAKTFQVVNDIAKRVRVWAEEQAVIRGFDEVLCGMCASASAKLHQELQEVGVESKILYSCSETYGDHCFVVVDGHIVDVTATQFEYFDFEPVVIRAINKHDVGHYRFWRATQTFKNAIELINFQVANEWPEEQMAA